jgi:hypothetical protein
MHLDKLAISYANIGNYETALDIAGVITFERAQADTFVAIAKAYLKGGRALQAKEKETLSGVEAELRKRLDPRYGYTLEIIKWSWSRVGGGFLEVVGKVKNISDKKLSNVIAIASFYDRKDRLITYETSLIEYEPLLPGQSSPFKIIGRYNPAMDYANIDFKVHGGGLIPTFRPKK